MRQTKKTTNFFFVVNAHTHPGRTLVINLNLNLMESICSLARFKRKDTMFCVVGWGFFCYRSPRLAVIVACCAFIFFIFKLIFVFLFCSKLKKIVRFWQAFEKWFWNNLNCFKKRKLLASLCAIVRMCVCVCVSVMRFFSWAPAHF